ncbi:Protein of unknown function [Pyronema omphalodes CBS 100304]|uniref:Uncharacterized protein n=1 Tax=Pyronema omphalodes (strain CBS 100304) TaxID=1076935 RepID=U4LQ03_PYROM|nr:Protein of unknown function [Pyronema omphalodes CBS 100304]
MRSWTTTTDLKRH